MHGVAINVPNVLRLWVIATHDWPGHASVTFSRSDKEIEPVRDHVAINVPNVLRKWVIATHDWPGHASKSSSRADKEMKSQ